MYSGLTVLVALLACRGPGDPRTAAEQQSVEAEQLRKALAGYYELRGRHDRDGALAYLADDFQIQFEGGPSLNKDQAASSLGWDFGTNGEVEWQIVEQASMSILVEGFETNEFLALLRISGIPFRSAFYFADDGLILRQEYSANWEGISVPDSLQPAIDWASVHAPEELAEAYPEGRLVYTEASGRRWVALLTKWRQAQNDSR